MSLPSLSSLDVDTCIPIHGLTVGEIRRAGGVVSLCRPHPIGRFHGVQERNSVRRSESVLPVGRLNKKRANPPGFAAPGAGDTIQELYRHSVMEELVADHQMSHHGWVHVLAPPIYKRAKCSKPGSVRMAGADC